MLEGGEDPRFIVRRMVILASEDIGNADPAALSLATAAAAGGRARRPARGALRARPGRDLPRARAQVRRRRAARSARPARTCASTARRRCPRGCAPGPRPRRRAAAATRTRTRCPATWAPQELLPDGASQGERFYEPDEAEAALAERLARDPRGARRDRRDNRVADEHLRIERDASAQRSLTARDPATGAALGSVAADAARAGARRWSRRSPRCSRCGRCCACATARATCAAWRRP